MWTCLGPGLGPRASSSHKGDTGIKRENFPIGGRQRGLVAKARSRRHTRQATTTLLYAFFIIAAAALTTTCLSLIIVTGTATTFSEAATLVGRGSIHCAAHHLQCKR